MWMQEDESIKGYGLVFDKETMKDLDCDPRLLNEDVYEDILDNGRDDPDIKALDKITVEMTDNDNLVMYSTNVKTPEDAKSVKIQIATALNYLNEITKSLVDCTKTHGQGALCNRKSLINTVNKDVKFQTFMVLRVYRK